MIHERIKAIQSLVPSATFADGVPQYPVGINPPSDSAITTEMARLASLDLLTALETERNRRVDEAVGKTRSKLMTIAVCVDILIDHALGVELTQTKRDTLLASQADLDDVVTLYTRAGQLGARIQAGEDLGDITRDELWN